MSQRVSSEVQKAVFCTIVTPSHLKFALRLMREIAQTSHCEDDKASFLVVLVGAKERFNLERYASWVNIEYVEDWLASQTLRDLAGRYTPAEFCWALKPLVLQRCLGWAQQAYYFDADIGFFSTIAKLRTEMGQASILLTPHCIDLYDDRRLDVGLRQLTLLRSGIFNGGFIGVTKSDEADSFLQWWWSKTEAQGYNEPGKGMCGDQKWLDLVPYFFRGVKVSNDYGMNVAYWNIHEQERQKLLRDHISDLVFVHFSGNKAKQKNELSRHYHAKEYLELYEPLLTTYFDSMVFFDDLIVNEQYVYAKWWHHCPSFYRKWCLPLMPWRLKG